ncbi:MAG: hypothetical protein KKE24_04765 [Candidatus Thermoplasmatota archaeon]|nr:hypothetical protein [Candidatus Thermoplasmatota archaeon]
MDMVLDRVGRPGIVLAVIGLELFNGLMGTVSGLLFLAAPSGELMGLDAELLEGLPVGDFFLVGLFLLIAFGICPFIVSWGLITRSELDLARLLKKLSIRHWAWTGALVISGLEVAWMCVEVILIGIFSFTYVWLIVQMLIVVVLCFGGVRRYYA